MINGHVEKRQWLERRRALGFRPQEERTAGDTLFIEGDTGRYRTPQGNMIGITKGS